MQISSRFVGAGMRQVESALTRRRTTNYAAAVGDDNPLYFDDLRPEGIVAPPMFAVTLTWPISLRLPELLPIDDFPFEVLPTMVHYSETIQFHRLMRPGDKLVVKGELAGMLAHQAGTHVVFRYDAFGHGGDPVFTEFIGGMLRGVELKGGDRATDLPLVPEAPPGGDPVWEKRIHVEATAPYVYDGCTNIVFAIHTSPAFAKSVGLPDVILQGTATLALAARELINRELGADPAGLSSLSCRFTGMVFPGTDIRVRLLGRRKADGGQDLFFDVLNQQGQRAVSHGHALVI